MINALVLLAKKTCL